MSYLIFYIAPVDPQMVDYVFECHLLNGNVVHMRADKVKELKVLHTEPNFQLNCPAVVFELFEDNGKAL